MSYDNIMHQWIFDQNKIGINIMKRHPALQAISREHHQTLSLSQQIIRAVKDNNLELMNELSEKVAIFSEQDLKPHFKKEEESFFKVIAQEYPEHQSTADIYLNEHKQLLEMGSAITSASPQQLEDFAILLKSHTRNEERILFPLIEKCFSEEQLVHQLRYIDGYSESESG